LRDEIIKNYHFDNFLESDLVIFWQSAIKAEVEAAGDVNAN
jgi:hypothetical protein